MFWLLGGTLFLELFSMFFLLVFLNQLLKIPAVVYTHDLQI